MLKSSVLVVIGSAGINPWLEIERSGQERLICENARIIKDHIWISANPNFVLRSKHRLLISIAKFQMWHYPGAGKYFVVLRQLLITLLKFFPIQLAMRKVFLASSKKPLGTLAGKRVELDLPTPMFVAGHRTIHAFEWALQNSEFDYLVRITSTCLINEPELMRFIDSLPKHRVYAGQKSNSYGSNAFMSGAAIVLSRDVVAGIVSHKNKYRFDMYEDVALGRLICEFNVADFIPMGRLDLPSIQAAEQVSLEELANATVIRCKAETITESPEPVLRIFRVVANRLEW